MAQQEHRNVPDSEQQRALGGKSRRGGSNNVIIGTIIVIGAIVFSFVFFGNWEGAEIGRTEGVGGTADGEAAATYGEGEPADVEGVSPDEQ
jgi:hypothetical protein